MQIYLVGGAVRDELLGWPVTERDWVVVGSSAPEMLAMGYLPVGKSFPVFLHPQTREEYALARTERKVAGGYHGFVFDASTQVTLEEDLARRDLTINAIAQSKTGQIIDPYGGGKDLQHKILRHVSKSFVEDPVRVLRVARFLARYAHLGFQIAKETWELMREMVEDKELDFLVPERIWKEMVRALSERTPVAFIQVLRTCGGLKVILPEIESEGSAESALQQATYLSEAPQVRFAALVHNQGEKLVKALCQRLRVPSDFQTLAQLVTKWHKQWYDTPQKTPAELLTLLEACDAFRRPDRFDQFLQACEAGLRGHSDYEEKEIDASAILRKALAYANNIKIQDIIQKVEKPTGEKIKAAIQSERVVAIARGMSK